MAELTVIEKAMKGEGDHTLLAEGISLLKIGAANPAISSTAMILIAESLGKIPIGKSRKAPVINPFVGLDPNIPIPLGMNYIEAAGFTAGWNFVTWLNSLGKSGSSGSGGGSTSPPPPPKYAIAPDGKDQIGDYWNVYLLDPGIKTALETALLSYLVGSGIGGGAGMQQLGSLVSGAVALLK
jgi:hypothetical protein